MLTVGVRSGFRFSRICCTVCGVSIHQVMCDVRRRTGHEQLFCCLRALSLSPHSKRVIQNFPVVRVAGRRVWVSYCFNAASDHSRP